MTDNSEPQVSEDGQQVVSESQIAVHWREEEYYYPPEAFVAQANASDPAIFDRFGQDRFPDCFTEYAELLDWDRRWDSVLDTSDAPFWKWFGGGRLNASYQLCGPACPGEWEQGGADLGARARGRGACGDHVPGAVSPGE